MTQNQSLSEKLARIRHKSRNAQVVISSMRDEIIQALKDGWHMTEIWRVLSEDKVFACTYQTFRYALTKCGIHTPKKQMTLDSYSNATDDVVESASDTTEEAQPAGQKVKPPFRGRGFAPSPQKHEFIHDNSKPDRTLRDTDDESADN